MELLDLPPMTDLNAAIINSIVVVNQTFPRSIKMGIPLEVIEAADIRSAFKLQS